MLLEPWNVEGERGATAIEYAIMLSLIALVVIGSVAVLGLAVFDLFDSVPDPFSG